jgi:CBS domain-containing protein
VPGFESCHVGDAIGSPLITCRPETPMDEVAGLMASNRVSAVVVEGLGGVESWGVVTDRNLLAVAADADMRSAAECATGRLLAIGPDEPVEAAVRLMQSHSVSRLMVTDGGRGLPLGILTTLDVAAALADGQRQSKRCTYASVPG